MSEPTVTPEIVRAHGLTEDEYRRIVEALGGRVPTLTELGMTALQRLISEA